MHVMNGVKESLMLYGVTDHHWLNGLSLHDAVEEAIKGGTTFIQSREKEDMALSHDAFLQEAKNPIKASLISTITYK